MIDDKEVVKAMNEEERRATAAAMYTAVQEIETLRGDLAYFKALDRRTERMLAMFECSGENEYGQSPGPIDVVWKLRQGIESLGGYEPPVPEAGDSDGKGGRL